MAIALAKFVAEASVHLKRKDLIQTVGYIHSAAPQYHNGLSDAVKKIFCEHRWYLMHDYDAK